MTEIIDTPTPACRELLVAIANYLAHARPTHAMWEASRLLLARQFAVARFGDDSARVDEAEREILGWAPEVRPGSTRDEYAAQLHLVAQGVTA
ncbi:hypothetical protein ACFV0H_07550 [Streptomyces erythrochromogenes]|uniref:hypothetical protein n=1 Tax=Streptomyces erythrochromogenes TaxID=285574 RepID=UPI0036D1FE22